MPAPSQMFETFLDPIRGWFSPECLHVVAKKAAAVTFDIPAGRCVSLNASGEFITGIATKRMGMFLFQGSDALDVTNPSGTTARGTFVSQPILPNGAMMALVANGTYELSSTEFDRAQTYVVNDYLTGTVADTNAVTGGLITNKNSSAGALVAGTHPICGVVSKINTANEYGIPTIEFWSVYMPVG